MVSKAANFGKRGAAAAPSRMAAHSAAPRDDDLPDARPASVIATQNQAAPVRPVAVTPGRFSRLHLWLAGLVGIGLCFYLLPLRHPGNAAPIPDAIRAADMPHDVETATNNSFALIQKYPRDPRAHIFRGVYFLDRRDAGDAEPYLRSALALGAQSPLMTPQMQDWTKALLALDLVILGRPDEARTTAAPLCGRDDLDSRAQDALKQTRLCQ
jgi:hypothetical protein